MADTRKERPLNTIKILLAAFLITGLVVYSYKYLPQRELILVPSDDLVSFYLDTTGTSHFTWLNQVNRKFRCTYDDVLTASRFCGLNVQQGDGVATGIDWSVYDEMDAQISYTGKAEILRLYLRDFSPEFSKVESALHSSKYLSVMIPTNGLSEHLIIDLNEFTIPEWWILHAGIERGLTYPEFNNITHLGIDVPYPAPHGDHELELKSVRLTGLYVSKDGWYLIVLGVWGVILFILVIKREFHLRNTSKIVAQNLVKEKVKAEQLKQVSEKYKELAIVDTLTGVFNRRGIYQFYEYCFEGGSGEEGSVIILDIDHFKKVNDTYGHDTGDKVIQSIGRVLRDCVRDHDSVGRWGGEEFLILCVNTNVDGAAILAEKIRVEVESLVFESVSNLHISVSLGISQINQNNGFEENVKAADLALYKAKQSGRNCWVTAG